MAGQVNVPSHAADTLPCVLYYCYGNLILHPLKVIGLAEPSTPVKSLSNWHSVSIKVCQLSGWVSSSVLSQHWYKICKWALLLARFFVVFTCCPLLVGFLVILLRAGSGSQPKSNIEPIQIETTWLIVVWTVTNQIQFHPTSGCSFESILNDLRLSLNISKHIDPFWLYSVRSKTQCTRAPFQVRSLNRIEQTQRETHCLISL